MKYLKFKKSQGITDFPNSNHKYFLQQGTGKANYFFVHPSRINLPAWGGTTKSIGEKFLVHEFPFTHLGVIFEVKRHRCRMKELFLS